MDKKLYNLMNWPRIEGVIYNEDRNPFDILGPHNVGKGNVLFQCFYPNATKVVIHNHDTNKASVMEMVDEKGYFACLLKGTVSTNYEYEVFYQGGVGEIFKDPYSYTEVEDEVFSDNFHKEISDELYNHLGSIVTDKDGIKGVRFALWAPNALGVTLELKTGLYFPMEYNEQTGIFSIFIPDIAIGDEYRYIIHQHGGITLTKLDPFSLGVNESKDYSIVRIRPRFDKNKRFAALSKDVCSIFQLDMQDYCTDNHLDNARIKMDELAKSISELKFTHVCISNAIITAKENSDIPFCLYTLSDSYGGSEIFDYLVCKLHEYNIRVLMEMNYSCFSKEEGGLAHLDGTYLYGHMDERRRYHGFTGDYLYNFGRTEVQSFLISNMRFWVHCYGVDGFVFDDISAVLYHNFGKDEGFFAPNMYGGVENLEGIAFLKIMNRYLNKKYPHVLKIARENSTYPLVTGEWNDDGLMFDLKINNGYAEEIEHYFSLNPDVRSHCHNELTNAMNYQYSEKFITPINIKTLTERIMESGADLESSLRLAISYGFFHPGKKFIEGFKNNLFLEKLLAVLNDIYGTNASLEELDSSSEGFTWLNEMDSTHNRLSFTRNDKKSMLLCVGNFSAKEQNITIGLNKPGKYKEIFCSEASSVGGEGSITRNALHSKEKGAEGFEYSITLKLPPLSLKVFQHSDFSAKEKEKIDNKKKEEQALNLAEEFFRLAIEKEEAAQTLNKEVKAMMLQVERLLAEAQEARQKAKKEQDKAQNYHKKLAK